MTWILVAAAALVGFSLLGLWRYRRTRARWSAGDFEDERARMQRFRAPGASGWDGSREGSVS